MKTFLSLFVLFTSTLVFAQEHGAEVEEIPTKLITYEFINVVIMIAGLVYYLKTPVRNYFKEKKAAFLIAAQKAEHARKLAEDERQQLQVKLSKLESTADESVARARAEATDMKKQMIIDAEAMSKRIRDEAQISAKQEVEKAKVELRNSLLKASVDAARTALETKVSADDQKRLQSDFIQHVQAVQK